MVDRKESSEIKIGLEEELCDGRESSSNQIKIKRIVHNKIAVKIR